MKTALLTGSSSGIGKAICTELKENGYKIFTINRNDGDIICDLQDTKALHVKLKEFLKTTDIDLLVNCAGLGVFEPHEEISFQKINEIIDVNLKAPILLTNLCLRSLKKTKGHIINISSIEATRHSKFSALYTATKSGLRDFSLALFEELRKSGVRVTNINPDMTKTAFFDELNFEPSDKEDTHLLPQEIAKTLLHVITSPMVVTDITVRAQKFEIKRK
ncbi:SDR family oxidoreductase [Sulfurospirillum arcachonense]|uniref:SDR family oxidoreductase n=1 Tax=Sulfurospirillum arcachonense TaxID=57666 RepID=UPI0004696F9C|nr:SDR family NAD(P)-dependent oxidoreductase [Sulfurospirillum arcachonense]